MIKNVLKIIVLTTLFLSVSICAFAKEEMMKSWEECMGFKVISSVEGESIAAQYRKILSKDQAVYLAYKVPFVYVNGLYDDDQLTYAQLRTWPYAMRIEINKGNSYYEVCYDERKQALAQKALNSLFGSKGPKKVYEHLEVDGILYDKGKISKKPVQYQKQSNLLNALGFLFADSDKAKNINQYKFEQFTAAFITQYGTKGACRCERYSNDQEVYTYIFDSTGLIGFAEGGPQVNTVGIYYAVTTFKIGGFDENILQIPTK